MNTRWVIVGGGFAGAATAWALGRAGLGPGTILEQELACGAHASGRNAGIMKLAESDGLVSALGRHTLRAIDSMQSDGDPLLRRTGGVTLVGEAEAPELELLHRDLSRSAVSARLLTASQAKRDLPILEDVRFHAALWCGDEGVVDVHALLGRYLEGARSAGFSVRTRTRVKELITVGGRAAGVITDAGEEIHAEAVVDASGAWAGSLGRAAAPLPLTPLRRHLFVTAPSALMSPEQPFVWMDEAALYFRPESGGLLMSPCDETPAAAGAPDADPAAAELLGEKLTRWAPRLIDLAIRRSWACLRTFAPDRRALIGPDPDVPGLFHVSGLGGFGVTCSAAIGELAAAMLAGRSTAWVDPSPLLPSRFTASRKAL
jgi:D-arginine dehydrogenase